MDILIFIYMNIVVAFSAFFIASVIYKELSKTDFLITWFILYLGQIILTELILGISGILNITNLIALNTAIFLLIYILSGKNALKLPKSDFYFLKELFKSKICVFIIITILVFGITKFCINLVNPPFGWDSINYHFTFAVEWLKHGNLAIPPTVFDDPSPSYYPINGSLFYLWLILSLKSVFLADLGQVPFFALSVLTVYSISRKVGLDKRYSFYTAGLFLLVPNFFKQLQIAYVDVMVAGLFLAAVNYLLSLRNNFNWQNVLLFGISLGLLMGTKTIALPYSAVLFIPFIYLFFKNRNKFYYLILCFVPILLLGGFSYLRNLFETGNPMYPLNFIVFGKQVFKGVMDSAVYRAHFSPSDYNLSKALFHEGLGMQTLIFVLPGTFLGLLFAVVKKKGLDFLLAYFMLLPILLYLVYRYLIPLANLRYLYSLLGIGMILGFCVTKLLNIPKPIVSITVIVCAIASMAELAKRQELVVSVILTVLLFCLLLFLRKKISLSIIVSWKIISLVLLGCFAFLFFTEKWYIKNEFPRYLKMVKYSGFWPDAAAAWDWLNSNTKGSNIAYAGRPVPFPLYGSQFKNNVYYVSVNKTEPARLHNFPNSKYEWGYDFESLHKNFEAKGNYRADADYNAWLSNLKNRKIDFLFIYSLHQIKGIEFPIENNWAAVNPQKFESVYSNQTIHIYKVKI